MTRPTTMNDLPNEILYIIISLLPSIEQVVRSSIVCKRWKPLWMGAVHFDFDEKHMEKIKNSRYREIVLSLLHRHSGDLTSCCFRQFRMSRDVNDLAEFVTQKFKRLSSLTIECVNQNLSLYLMVKVGIFANLCSLELTNYTLTGSASSAFDGCEKLKILKMKNMHVADETINGILKNCLSLEKFSLMDIKPIWLKKLKIKNPSLKILELQSLQVQEIDVSTENLDVLVLENVTCPPESLKVYALRLKALYSSCNSTKEGILKTDDIIANCTDLIESHKINIFQYLSTLVIDLDFHNKSDAYTLLFVLRSCPNLKTLEITIPVDKRSNSGGYSSAFRRRLREMDNCVSNGLKFATIRGFTGTKQEVKFVKHLITNAYMIKRISIISNYSKVAKAKVETRLRSLCQELQFSCPKLHLELDEDEKGSFILLILKHLHEC